MVSIGSKTCFLKALQSSEPTSHAACLHLICYQNKQTDLIDGCREFQGPVTAIAAVEGFLVVAWGSRLESHKWTGVKLETTAFHEASVMLTSVTTIKRFLACGDVHKGVSFLQMTANTGAFVSLAKVSNCSLLLNNAVDGKDSLAHLCEPC